MLFDLWICWMQNIIMIYGRMCLKVEAICRLRKMCARHIDDIDFEPKQNVALERAREKNLHKGSELEKS